MIKVKINEGYDYELSIIKKGKNVSLLEDIVLLDLAIDSLRKDRGLNNKEIVKLLEDYRKEFKKGSE